MEEFNCGTEIGGQQPLEVHLVSADGVYVIVTLCQSAKSCMPDWAVVMEV